MAGEIDTFLLEKQLGSEFAKRLRSSFRNAISSTTSRTRTVVVKGKEYTYKNSGLALKSTVTPVYRNNELYSLMIKTPYYIYPILHYGFEGSKKEGINKRIAGRNMLNKAIQDGKLVQDLADRIGEVRAKEIVSRISFGFDINIKSSNSIGNE